MIVERTVSIPLIKSIMFIDEIWDVVTEDHHERKHYEPNLQTTAWFTVTDDGRVVALLALDVVNSVTLRIHPMVIPTERVRSVEICKTLIDWWLALDDEHTKLIAEIPECYKHVKRFAVKMGLKPEGIRTKSYRRNGDIIDVYLYGATKEGLKDGISRGR